MSDSAGATPTTPAGWYKDPADSARLRWWDGSQWTSTVQNAPLGRPAEAAYVPFQRSAQIEQATNSPGLAYTRTMWWISAQPIWGVVTQVMLFALVTAFGSVPAAILVPGYLILNLALLAVLVGLAFADRRALLQGGNQSAASPWWMLLSPLVYLILRARQVALWEEGAWAAVLWWSIAAVLSPVLAILGYFAVLGVLPV
ncbi:MAG TPA: DUF2510 domain-containing protein [Galbitalea sp.]